MAKVLQRDRSGIQNFHSRPYASLRIFFFCHLCSCTALKSDVRFVGMTGGQIVTEVLKEQGVEHIFGYPGGAILPVFDQIHDSNYFKFILPRHEQGAGHAAEGYAKVFFEQLRASLIFSYHVCFLVRQGMWQTWNCCRDLGSWCHKHCDRFARCSE